MAQSLLVSAVAAGCALLAAGCSTPKAVKSTEAATAGMQNLATSLEASRAQIAIVMTALNDVVTSAAEPKNAHRTFRSEVARLDRLVARTHVAAERMETTTQEHYALWDEELSAISNPELKQQSIERKAEVTKAFADVKEAYLQVSYSFKPYVNNLQALDRYLAADLTAAGIDRAANTINGLKTESVAVQRDIQAAVAKINELQTSMGRPQN